ncbi:MAG: peptidoglycan DD-metalloendopeptidase family protein [Gammaproteobacteria bacterium]|nr:peptidoglycan DD-metalloendopeptidase family protein [Gammaproteobacteria bacterium]
MITTTKKIVVVALLSVFSASYAADKLADNKKQLTQISQQIASAQHDLQQTLAQETSLQQALQKAEQSIGSLSTRIHSINDQIKKNDTQLKKSQQQEQRYQNQLNSQRAALAKQLQFAYQDSRESDLKILLNQENPYQLSRILTYYQYMAQAHLQAIQAINDTITQLQQTQVDIKQNTEQLKKLRQDRLSQQNDLQSSKAKRQKVLKQIHSKAQTQSQRLTTLISNKRALENVIQQLRNQQASTPFIGKNFAAAKGRMSWPTAGRITRTFNTVTIQDMHYNGVFIKAATDQPIHSVAPGKVVFANWLKGFGLLMIVDHGNGYMTLYAHCNSLYKGVGDVVSPSDTIATVGDSGGEDETGLMFQIRYNGKAIDPSKWCR